MADNPLRQTEDFVRLHSQSHPRVLSYILSLIPNRTDAEDIMQETSVILWQKFAEFEPGTNFASWACRVAYYKVLEFRKRAASDKLQFDHDLLELVSADSLEWADTGERHDAVHFCLDKLSTPDRELIERRYRDGAKTKEVAEQVGRPVGAVYKSVRRIMNSLLVCIQRRLSREGRQ